MVDPFIATAINIKLSAEWSRIITFLGSLVNQGSEFPVNGRAIDIRLNKVLLYLLSHGFKQIAAMPNDGIDSQNGVALLNNVIDTK